MPRIVIEIPDNMYNDIQYGFKCPECTKELIASVKEGLVLPKGHDDLIYRNDVIYSLFDYVNGKKPIGMCVDQIEAVIPADNPGKWRG